MIFSPGVSLAQDKGGVINVATIGEPPTLDPMVSTADLVGIVTQHIFETLYTFDKEWKPTPLLAESLPEISADGKTYTIKLRSGIKFHDGSDMTSEDVVASLERWTKLASRGKQASAFIENIAATDPATVTITLKQPYAPLTSLLAFNNSAARQQFPDSMIMSIPFRLNHLTRSSLRQLPSHCFSSPSAILSLFSTPRKVWRRNCRSERP